MKVIVTTSDAYHHCLPVFFKTYNRHWGDPFDLVGYKEPPDLPENCTFVSLGKQRGPEYFSDDLAPYFAKQPLFFVWMMEDTFIKGFDRALFEYFAIDLFPNIGRFCLTNEGMKRPHFVHEKLYECPASSDYRLSTQPSIWNREFLLKYLTPGLTPWKFETQKTRDRFMVIGPVANIMDHNEGVRKHDIHNLNLEGLEL